MYVCLDVEDVSAGVLSAADMAAVSVLDGLLVTAKSSSDFVGSSACMAPTLDLINYLCTYVEH